MTSAQKDALQKSFRACCEPLMVTSKFWSVQQSIYYRRKNNWLASTNASSRRQKREKARALVGYLPFNDQIRNGLTTKTTGHLFYREKLGLNDLLMLGLIQGAVWSHLRHFALSLELQLSREKPARSGEECIKNTLCP